ncbi:40s ribosomal protein s5-1 [Hordeum vulgare]|nr:40s ribosomal protein s5-1 [Hordeum vulgare]
MEARLEAMEQQVLKCQGMVERGLDTNHMMIMEFTNKRKIDANDIGKHLSRLYDRIDHLQNQIYDLQNQNYVFPSTDGIRLRVRLEGAEDVQAPPPPPNPAPSSSENWDDGSSGGGMNPSGGSGGGTDARFTQFKWDRLGPEVQDVLKKNAPKDDVHHVEVVLAAAFNEKSAPVGTPISGVCSNMSVRPMSPSKSGIEDMVVSPA